VVQDLHTAARGDQIARGHLGVALVPRRERARPPVLREARMATERHRARRLVSAASARGWLLNRASLSSRDSGVGYRMAARVARGAEQAWNGEHDGSAWHRCSMAGGSPSRDDTFRRAEESCPARITAEVEACLCCRTGIVRVSAGDLGVRGVEDACPRGAGRDLAGSGRGEKAAAGTACCRSRSSSALGIRWMFGRTRRMGFPDSS
jgi:hypothetical protein